MTRVQLTKWIGARIPLARGCVRCPELCLRFFPDHRDDRYVVEEEAICIVDPETYEIVDVPDEGTYAPVPRQKGRGFG
jgi:hypothetical protein